MMSSFIHPFIHFGSTHHHGDMGILHVSSTIGGGVMIVHDTWNNSFSGVRTR